MAETVQKNHTSTTAYALAALLAALTASAEAQIRITEVAEGVAANFKYVEIKNETAAAINLASPVQYSIRRFSNGGTTPAPINLTGTIPAKGRYVIANNATDYKAVFGAAADASQYNTGISHNGDDSYDLFDGTSILDGFGKDWVTGVDPGDPASNMIAFRSSYAAGGNFGQATKPADGTATTNGEWTVVYLAVNADAATVGTPFAAGGASGAEVPVTMSTFSVE